MRPLACLLTLAFLGCGGGSPGTECACLNGNPSPFDMSMNIEQCVFVTDVATRPTDPYEYCDCKAVGTGAAVTHVPTCN